MKTREIIMADTLQIQKPTEENIKKAVSGLTEIKNNPTPFDIRQSNIIISYMDKDFDGFFEFLKQRESPNQPEGWVPDTTFFLFDGDQFVGLYAVRLALNEKLKKEGGHIAYQIVPSFRGKGYCKKGLKLVLEWLHENLGLEEALLTCRTENPASHHVMLSVKNEMGGHEQEDIIIDGHIEHRVWIKTYKIT